MRSDRFVDIVFIVGIIAIIVLKIIGVITIPWIWLLCPIWGLLGLGIIFAVFLTIACIISNARDKRRKNNERY